MLFKSSFMVALLLIVSGVLVAANPGPRNHSQRKPLVFMIGVSRYRDSGEFYRGEPIFVHAGMRRLDVNFVPKDKLMQIGIEKHPWYRNITFSVYRLEQVKSGEHSSGQPRGTSVGAEPNDKPLSGKEPEEKAPEVRRILLKDVQVKLLFKLSTRHKLKVNQKAWSSWVIDPNTTAGLSASKYLIKAMFDTMKEKKLDSKILRWKSESNEVTIVINQPITDAAKADVLSGRAQYLGRTGKYADERKLLMQLQKIDPTEGRLHVRLGRAYELEGDIDSALKEYRAYVRWVRSLNLPRTGADDLNDHADIIEQQVKIMEDIHEQRQES